MKTITLVAPDYSHVDVACYCKECGRPLTNYKWWDRRPVRDDYIAIAECCNPNCFMEGQTLSAMPEQYAKLDTAKYKAVSHG